MKEYLCPVGVTINNLLKGDTKNEFN